MESPNVLDYENYRDYLRDWYKWMKATKEGFSYRSFSKWAGFSSPNHLQLIIQGKRNITPATMGPIIKILKLNRRERHYFELVVQLNQATNSEAKARYLEELSAYFRKYQNNLKHNQCEYLSKWYYPVLRELITTERFRSQYKEMARRIDHGVSARKIEESVTKLLELGLISKDAQGRLAQSEAVISTGAETQEAASYFYHDQMIRLALAALREQLPHERNFSAITLACRDEDVAEIAQILTDCRRRILTYLEGRGTVKDDDVYQLNLQFFRVTKPKSGKKK